MMQTYSFLSRRNQVYPVIRQDTVAVQKYFTEMEDWQREQCAYALLRGWEGIPALLESSPGHILTQWIPGRSLLEELERQEREGFCPEVWQALSRWLQSCHSRCGMVPGEGNLRNFVLSDGQIVGLDLEALVPGTPRESGARIAAWLQRCDPVGTPEKARAVSILCRELGISEEAVEAEENILAQRQKRRIPCSAIILSGGRSSRMGVDKSQLQLFGETMLQRQIRKLRSIGIRDILISGTQSAEDLRSVPDIYPGRGPLGGLHACLQQAKYDHCLVISVDAPLVPASMLDRLCRVHQKGATVLCHGAYQEPLIAVYDREVACVIQTLIAESSAPVRALRAYTSWQTVPYLGPEAYLHNCNTPEDYETALQTLSALRSAGIDYL